MNEQLRHQTAIHESAHAVIAQMHGISVSKIEITPGDSDHHGLCHWGLRPLMQSSTNYKVQNMLVDWFISGARPRDIKILKGQISSHMAGYVAENVYLGVNSFQAMFSGDWAKAEDLCNFLPGHDDCDMAMNAMFISTEKLLRKKGVRRQIEALAAQLYIHGVVEFDDDGCIHT